MFDMSGGCRHAKHAGERPLDGGVERHTVSLTPAESLAVRTAQGAPKQGPG
jgi:hypothetical protein